MYLAEQEAAAIVAKRIAEDPPKALMAVISTQNVGGWSGRKRRGPNEEGGGAPCPPEFLLNREKRTTNPNGPTRQKPAGSNNNNNDSNGSGSGGSGSDEEDEKEQSKEVRVRVE